MITPQDTSPDSPPAKHAPLSDASAELLHILQQRDQRIALLVHEVEERSQRLSRLEAGFEAMGIPTDSSPVTSDVQVFWLIGSELSETRSLRQRVREDGTLHELNFELPIESEDTLRIDIGAKPGFWEIESLAVFSVDAEATRSSQPLAECNAITGFSTLQLTVGLLPIAASSPSGPLRLYAYTDDPQLYWRLPSGTVGRKVLRIRGRAMGLQWGLRNADSQLFQQLLETALSDPGLRKNLLAQRQNNEQIAALCASTATQFTSELTAVKTAISELRSELDARSTDREKLNASLSQALVATETLARELDAKDHSARTAEAELSTARQRLAAADLRESELAALRLELVRTAKLAAQTQPAAPPEVHPAIAERNAAFRDRDQIAAERDRLSRKLEESAARTAAEEIRFRREADALAAERAQLAQLVQQPPPLPLSLPERISRRLLGRPQPIVSSSPVPSTPPSSQPNSTPVGYELPAVRSLFDERHYRTQAADAGSDALAHYLSDGWRRNLDPHPLFSTTFYLDHSPDVRDADTCPLVHYVLHGGAEGRSPHPLFDVSRYAHANPAYESARAEGTSALQHYLSLIAEKASPHCPCPIFDERYYRHLYQDVARSGYPPLLHYAAYGTTELRNPSPLFDARFYVEKYPDIRAARINPLAHYLTKGSSEHRDPHPLFSTAHYLTAHPQVQSAGMNALDHYMQFGWKLGWDPSPHFSVGYYLRENPDVARKDIEPLTHFVQFGFREYRDPSPDFDVRYYILANPQVARDGVNPLVHFLSHHGQKAALPPEAFTRLIVLLDDPRSEFARSIEATSPVAVTIAPADYEPLPGDYVYAPKTAGLSPTQLASVALCLSFLAYDFIVVSHALDETTIATAHPDNALILSSAAYLRRRAGKPLAPGSTGRLLRLLPSATPNDLRSLSYADLALGDLSLLDADLVVLGPGISRPSKVARRRPAAVPITLPRDSAKPLIWAVPILLAVGGVERNMVEVLRELAPHFDFLVITTERLSPAHGSLHHQALAVSLGIFDLGEIAPPDLHLDLLSTLRAATHPDVVWTCNGSPWLADHAGEFKSVLGRAAIVDQQVYDAAAGWIAHFHDKPALKSFDRYIAINSHIHRAFTTEHAIADSRVDLIYHMIDDRRFFPRTLSPEQRTELLQKWNLPADRPLFAQIGRLTSQKQPLVFLAAAREALAAGDDAQFILVGSGELAPDCDKYITEHALTNVSRIPFIEDPSQFLPLLSGLVLCSSFEGLPIVTLEALACGIPLLSTDVGDVKLLTDEYASGTIIADGESPYAALCRFRQDLPSFTAAAARHAETVRHRFSSTTIGAQYESAFRRAIAQRSTRIDIGPDSGLSVVMPTYNRRETLQRTLRSCFRFSAGLPVDFIVVDDGSRDDTPAFLQSLAAAHPNLTVRHVPNGGPGKARNLGASLARRDALILMGDDAEPASPAYFTTHLDLHRRNPELSFAVLGKMVWPDRPDSHLSFAMAHIQGHGGEQFGYADLVPYQQLDWRFFYTANISLKRRRVADWLADGFAPQFRFAAWEDAELAYRLSSSPPGLHLMYAPSSLAYHHHPYSVDQFINRQTTAGMMLKVMLDLHPELTGDLLFPELLHALAEPHASSDQTAFADIAAILEGLKAWARLLDTRRKIGSVAWHDKLISAVFDAAYYQGYLMAVDDPHANIARAYERLIDRCYSKTQSALENEFLGYATRSNKLIPTR